MPRLRSATSDDSLAIAHVHVEAWRSAYRGLLPAEALAALSVEERAARWQSILLDVQPPECFLVAEDEGRVVGFVHGGPEREGDPRISGEVYALYLLSDVRGRGVGSALFRQAVAALQEGGLSSLKVWVLRDNPYRGFYNRHGGRVVAECTTPGGLPTVAYGWDDTGGVL